MPLYTTKAAPRARQGLLLVSPFAGPGACGLLGLLVLALLAGALLAVPVRAQVVDLSTARTASDSTASTPMIYPAARSAGRAMSTATASTISSSGQTMPTSASTTRARAT